jgi:predicted AlkP superfamily pyrophosphatase or phosphodiesterase
MLKKNIILFFAAALILTADSFAQTKLVVGIVVDQMRYDYLTRFEKEYGEGGFKRLMNEGTDFTYAHFNYMPTVTAVGHSSVYTGTIPYYHGIIGNEWYDKKLNRDVYCTEDTTETTIGAAGDEGKMSPRNLLSNTITDQLKLFSAGNSKVISICIKDRGAILPGGHSADAAYWYSHSTGRFISSSYYCKALPAWLNDFNNKKLPDQYLKQDWALSLPADKYYMSSPDNVKWEPDMFNEGKNTFPHSFKNIDPAGKYSTLIFSPYGNQLLLELAKETITNENLGKRDFVDFLAISFSSTDYIGHAYGPSSVEVEDTYIKLDKQIAELLSFLDQKVGKDKYILFLTADHGGSEAHGYLRSVKQPAGEVNRTVVMDSLSKLLNGNFKAAGIIKGFSDNQVFFNYDVIKNNNLNRAEIENYSADFLSGIQGIKNVYTRTELLKQQPDRLKKSFVLNGFNNKRSGDVIYEFASGYHEVTGNTATHNTSHSYDTHVPILFYGNGIPAKKVKDLVFITDIAPTVANLLGITEPRDCFGVPLLP